MGDDVLCRNCADLHHPRGTCSTCMRTGMPIEKNHVAGRKHDPAWTMPLCLSCHDVQSRRQMTYWHPSWRGDTPRPGLFRVQGIIDWLWIWSAAEDLWPAEYVESLQRILLPCLLVLVLLLVTSGAPIVEQLAEDFRGTLERELGLSESDWDDLALPWMGPP